MSIVRYFAFEGGVTTDVDAPGAIEITAGQYAEALNGMMAGQIVTIDGGFAVIDPPPPPEPAPEPAQPED